MFKSRKEIEAVLAKPLTIDPDYFDPDIFDPWNDLFDSIASYSSESDRLMVAVMSAVRDHKTFEVIDREGFIAEFMLYVLAGHGYVDYGTSPRGAWPASEIADLWDEIIAKWESHLRLVESD